MGYTRNQGFAERSVRGAGKYLPIAGAFVTGILGYVAGSSGSLITDATNYAVQYFQSVVSREAINYVSSGNPFLRANEIGWTVAKTSAIGGGLVTWRLKNSLLDWFFGKL